jgi:hypothetical protein
MSFTSWALPLTRSPGSGSSWTTAAGKVKGSPTIDEETDLTKARTVLAKKGYEFAMGTLEETGRGRLAPVSFARPEAVYRWSVRWLQVEREMSPRPTDHRAALEAHLKRMTELDKLVERLQGTLVGSGEARRRVVRHGCATLARAGEGEVTKSSEAVRGGCRERRPDSCGFRSRAADSAVRVPSSHSGSRRFESCAAHWTYGKSSAISGFHSRLR